MKLKRMKLKLITASLVLATSGSAHALIIDGLRGNGELFMTLLNDTKQISYTLDLNVTMDDFLNGVANGQTYFYAADANMQSFLATSDGDPMVWAIGAADSTHATDTNVRRSISTASVIDPADTLTNFKFRGLSVSADQMVGNVNGLIGSNASLIVTDPTIPAYAGSAQWGHNWGGVANFIATGEIGTSMDVYLLRQSSGAFAKRHQQSIYEKLSFNGNTYQATLDMGGNLTIAPVPEPETYALMLAGLGLVGWMARRRKTT